MVGQLDAQVYQITDGDGRQVLALQHVDQVLGLSHDQTI